MTNGYRSSEERRRQKMAKKKRITPGGMETLPTGQAGGKKKRIRFDYIKSNCFRVIRVDGAHGSPTPKGDAIQIALFSERNPIPQSEEYAITEQGNLGERLAQKTRGAIVREVEVEAILSIEMARLIEQWLHDKIAMIEKAKRQRR
jgi:hypothetical protein